MITSSLPVSEWGHSAFLAAWPENQAAIKAECPHFFDNVIGFLIFSLQTGSVYPINRSTYMREEKWLFADLRKS
jgi:hypothetical protein